jgi:hypothetical protein
MFTTSKDKLLKQQLRALHNREMREVLTPIPPLRMPAIAADARDVMFFEAPRYAKDIAVTPGTGFFDKNIEPLDAYGQARPRYSRRLMDVSRISVYTTTKWGRVLTLLDSVFYGLPIQAGS